MIHFMRLLKMESFMEGAADMKGAVAALVLRIDMQWRKWEKFCGDVYVAGVVHEECFEGVAARKISEKEGKTGLCGNW